MFCTKCGAQVADGAAFCTACGNPTGAAQAAVQPVIQPVAVQQVPQQVPQQMGQQAQPMYGAAPQQPYGQQPYGQQPYGQPMGAVPPTAPPTQMRGCFGSGWDDVKGSQGWFKKVALMALIDLVPIFSWVNVGYGWRWGKDVAMGRREDMPQKIVSGDNFKMGFFIFVAGLVFTLILYACGFVLGLIPVIGLILAIVLDFFASMFMNLAYMRETLFESIGAAFHFGKIFEVYKRNLGTLFCIAVVPGLIAGGIGFLIFLVYSLLVGLVGGADLLSVLPALANGANPEYVARYLMYNMGGSIAIVFILSLVFGYLGTIPYQFCMLVQQRAMGHYVARIAPEWAPEAAAAQQQAQFTAQQQAAAQTAAQAQAAAYNQQAVAGGPMPPVGVASQQPALQPMAPVAAPVTQVPAGVEAADAVAAPVAAAPAAAVAAVGAVAAAAQPEQPEQPEQPAEALRDPYDFAETSVLPEYDEDMDTIVQPELKVQPAVDDSPTGPAVSAEPVVPAAAPAVADAGAAPAAEAVEAAAPAADDGAVRLQPTVASGPLMGDDSDTMVLMEESEVAEPTTQVGPLPGTRTLRLTRVNGDVCTLTTFPVTIGKGSDADLVIEGNGAISRVHMRILRDGDTFAAEDLGSTNKTFIGTYELPPNTPTILSDGDELRLANELLHVSIV